MYRKYKVEMFVNKNHVKEPETTRLVARIRFFFYGSTALYGPGPSRFVEVS
jgi:hypothetical protein